MFDKNHPASTAPVSPEELEAAMAANASDEMTRLQTELAELKAKSADLADQFLRQGRQRKRPPPR